VITFRTPAGRTSAASSAKRSVVKRRLFGRLQHLRVPRGERGRELPDGHHQRVVPRRDPADDAERLAADHRRVPAHVLAGRLALEHAARAGEEPDVVGRDRHLVARVRQRLADVARLELREFLGVLVDQVGQLEQHLRALARRRVAPLLVRLLRGFHRAVDVRLRPARNLRDRLARRGIDHLHRPALGRVDPLTADEVLHSRDRAHVDLPKSYAGFQYRL